MQIWMNAVLNLILVKHQVLPHVITQLVAMDVYVLQGIGTSQVLLLNVKVSGDDLMF